MYDFLIPIPILSDNYSYMLRTDKKALIIDPGESQSIIDELEKLNLHLTAILCTHHHSDHVNGVEALKTRYNAKVYGPKDDRIPLLDVGLDKYSTLALEGFPFKIIETPGHTKSHIVFLEENHHILFSGDTLFGAGCGRLFEGSYEEMYSSLHKLSLLNPDTYIYFGHEYTLKNLEFAHQLFPDDDAIKSRLNTTIQLRKNHQFTIPSTLNMELKTNPFLRVHEQSIQKSLDMLSQKEVDVFAKLRQLRDKF
ncbi:MAG: hydroxyacylglutathione hydrolase [Chlamydiota bacterium]|jgi:hydroxyacylglutathione hydrolase